jgi:pimeloyl-ACP methyl ester carboxylesterase
VRRLIIPVLVLCTCIGINACRSTSMSKGAPAPAGLPSFYAVPSGVAQKSPGTLLKSQSLNAPAVKGKVRRIMYVSTDAAGRRVAVTGLVFLPAARPPKAGYPVVSWAHGTNGMAARCAPSLSPEDALPDRTVLNTMMQLGWAVTATDYQGEGTPPGLLPFLVGDVAGRNAIDIVVAAHDLSSANTGRRYIVWGHSEGGHSALFAWRLANTYGARSGLQMVGVVAGAPPSQLSTVYEHLTTTPYRVYDYMMLAGFNAAYGNSAAPLDAVLTPKGTELLSMLRQGCLAPVTAAVNAQPFAQLVSSNPLDVAAWRSSFAQNDPASFVSASKVPLIIIHGGNDEVVPVTTSAALADHLCNLGANLERWVYPAQNHGGALIASALDAGLWMKGRFAGQQAQYRPADASRAQVTTCPRAGG